MEHDPRPPQADARSGDRDRDAAAVLEVRNPLPLVKKIRLLINTPYQHTLINTRLRKTSMAFEL